MAEMLYPMIGVPKLGDSLLRQYFQYQYTRCLKKAGAQVQILTPSAGAGSVEHALKTCSGFLFPGGPDIQPQLYGQLAESRCGEPNRVRDAFELALIQGALAAGKPLFCICRGMQLLNVALGGTLTQDIRARQEYNHQDIWNCMSATHPVEIDPDSLLYRIFDADVATVNSMHHQAVDKVGEGLWIVADSPEGFPEALEVEGYPFCLAVQWHPEFMAAQVPAEQKLFRAFVDECRKI